MLLFLTFPGTRSVGPDAELNMPQFYFFQKAVNISTSLKHASLNVFAGLPQHRQEKPSQQAREDEAKKGEEEYGGDKGVDKVEKTEIICAPQSSQCICISAHPKMGKMHGKAFATVAVVDESVCSLLVCFGPRQV